MNDVEVLLHHSERPLVFVCGGNDVEKVIQLCQVLHKSADQFLLGGGAAFTFLYSRLIGVGNSAIDRDQLSAAFQVMDKASYLNRQFILPLDHLVSEKVDGKSKTKVFKKEIPHGFSGIDIGAKTIAQFQKYLQKAKTIVWFGSLAAFPQMSENKSNMILLKSLLKNSAYKALIGKEAIQLANEAGMLEKFNLVIENEDELLSFLPTKKITN